MRRILLGALMAVIVTAMTASVAQAQGQGRGLERSQRTAYGLDRQPICHNGKTLYLPEPTLDAHVWVHEDIEGECRQEGSLGCGVVAGVAVEVDEQGGTQADVIDSGDVLLIVGDFEPADSGTISVTLKDEDGMLSTFEDTNDPATDNADIMVLPGEGLRIGVRGDPTGGTGGNSQLNTDGLVVEESEGVDCADEGTDEVTGTLGTTKAGEPVLKTSSGDTLKLSTDSKQGKDTLKGLKGKSVMVKGELKKGKGKNNKTLKATSVVKAKGKK
jgi:hypothetical protein